MTQSSAAVIFREATRRDVPAVVALLQDDRLGAARETAEMSAYQAAFDEMQASGSNTLIVGEVEGRIVATYHLTIIPGITLGATRRAQIEGVRVASTLRGQGIGQRMLADVEARARTAGCGLVQLTMNTTRYDAHRFYTGLGFEASHVGFKKTL